VTTAVRRRDDEHPRDRRPTLAGPRNFLAPGERRRLFWLAMPAGVLLVTGLGWVERDWFPRPRASAPPPIDTRLEAVAGPPPRGDEVVMEGDAEPPGAASAVGRAADAASLARVRDATVFRDADNDAWFQVWKTIRAGDADAALAAAARDVSFRELFGQPKFFRGRPVRMKGRLRRTERLAAPRNDESVEEYWQCWLEPAGGPPSPVVIQCLSLPEGMPAGMAIDEPVEVTGYFFKNFAYNAADAIRVAPVIMTGRPFWRPAVPRSPRGLAGPGAATLVIAASLAAAVGAAWLGSAAGRRRSPAPESRVAGLDALLQDFEPLSVEESLRRRVTGPQDAADAYTGGQS